MAKTREQLSAELKMLVPATREFGVPAPENVKEIVEWIKTGKEKELLLAEQALGAWERRVQAAKTAREKSGRSVPPTPADLREVLEPRRAAIAAQAVASPSPKLAAASPKSPSSSPAPSLAPVAKQDFGMEILKFALKAQAARMQVGDGECWTLVNAAFLAAGASAPMYRGTYRGNDAYNFGQLVATITPGNKAGLNQAKAGDVMVLWDTMFRFAVPGGQMTMGPTERHATIVQNLTGSVLHVIESNVSGNKTAQAGDYNFEGLIAGRAELWRAQPPPPP